MFSWEGMPPRLPPCKWLKMCELQVETLLRPASCKLPDERDLPKLSFLPEVIYTTIYLEN